MESAPYINIDVGGVLTLACRFRSCTPVASRTVRSRTPFPRASVPLASPGTWSRFLAEVDLSASPGSQAGAEKPDQTNTVRSVRVRMAGVS